MNKERRPAIMKVHATHRLVERAVAVVVLAALDVALRRRDPYPHEGKGGPKVASAYIELA